jgi:hypothetical protein
LRLVEPFAGHFGVLFMRAGSAPKTQVVLSRCCPRTSPNEATSAPTRRPPAGEAPPRACAIRASSSRAGEAPRAATHERACRDSGTPLPHSLPLAGARPRRNRHEDRRARAARLGDVDEPRGRWRVSAGVAKTGTARWVTPPPVLFEAVCALVAREDRTPTRPHFQAPAPTSSAPRSRERVRRARFRRSHHMRSGTGVSLLPPRRDDVGSHRRARRPRRHRHDGAHVHARHSRRGRTRLRGGPPVSVTDQSGRGVTDQTSRAVVDDAREFARGAGTWGWGERACA